MIVIIIQKMKMIVMSKRDVIICRGIWYVMVLLSLLGLSISLNLLWPPGGKSSSSSRFSRDGAVSATTFYAVTILRFLFFTDLPSTNFYRNFTTVKERIPQLIFSELATCALYLSPSICQILVDKVEASFVLHMSLFAISLFTGGIGLIQLSDKFRMEMRYAYFTLFSGLLCGQIGLYMSIGQNMVVIAINFFIYLMICSLILGYNLPLDLDGDTSSVSPLAS